jgi:hypothetical protein
MINFLRMVLVIGRTVAMVGAAFQAMAAVVEVVARLTLVLGFGL